MSNFAAIANGSTTSPYYSIEQVPIPNVPKDKILIKTVAFAANPTDWKHIELGYVSSGSILGTDVSGIVIEVGSDVTGFAKGDYVSSWVHGSHKPGQGAYQNYNVLDTAPTLKFDKSTFSDDALPVGTTPLGVVSSFEAAASLPLGISTVGLSFANSFKIDVNADNKNSFILVWGGATATGIIAIQVAKLMYGLKVITTASPRNREFLTGLGADFVIDYNDKDAVDQIRSIGSSSIRWALDTVGTLETYQAVYDATSLSEDITIDELLFHEPSVLKQDPSRKSVKFITTVGYFVFGEPINVYVKSTTYPPAGLASDFEEFKKNLLPILPKIKTARLRTLKSGLESFNEAYSLLKEEKVSGEKVVWRI